MSISSVQKTKFRLVSVDDLEADTDEAGPAEFIGRTIANRYTLVAHLGGGGMADVYRASDAELGIDVAVKLLKPGIASNDMRARMVQEARAAARVRHGNLVRVFGAGMFEDTAYIAMELLDGPNLEDHLRGRPRQRLPWPEALELLLPALEALHAVHERGYVHRDIKPGNLLVVHEPSCPPRAVVIDLGLAKPDRVLRDVDEPPTTATGRVLCTPGYASPEQACERPLDRRSDVYSMGITLYRVLAGRLPFHKARGQPIQVVFAHHVGQVPTRLADAAPDVDIPPAIARIIESALAKDPAARPQTMQALADALQAAALAASPAPRSPFHRWPYGLVLVQILIVLWTSRMIPGPRETPRVDPSSSPGATGRAEEVSRVDPTAAAAPAEDPPEDSAPPTDPSPPAAPETSSREQPRRRPDPVAVARRELARRAPAVRVCAGQATGSRERLAVVVSIDAAGLVSAHVDGAADTPLSRCLDRVLRHTTPSPPKRALSFVHTFTLQETPRP